MRSKIVRFFAAVILVVAATSAPAVGRRVIYVERGHTGGTGSYGSPLGSLAEAQQMSHPGDVIFVAESMTPYEESITLQKGQMLIGSAFGLDAVRSELHIDVDAPSLPAAQGTGPIFHGTISLPGDNILAGCTVIADGKNGAGVVAQSPQGPITLRTMFLRSSNDAWAFYAENSAFEITWTNGRLDAARHGSGILINGGSGNVTVNHVAIAGEFANAIAVRGRTAGTVAFRNGSAIKVSDASREAVALTDSRGSIVFESPLQVKTSGGRGLVANHIQRLAVTGGSSWIETTNATAADIRDAGLDVVFDRISAEGVAPGRLTDAVILDKVRGRFEITGDGTLAGSGGIIRNALSYGMRLTQSTAIHVRNMTIAGGGSLDSPDECPQDVPKQTNLRCRAGLYLRHLERAAFENITIEDNGGVGLNTNNLTDVTFSDVHVSRTGDRPTEPALLIDEARGRITFTRCSFVDGGGGAVVVEQRFNKARLTFNGCDIAAPQRPLAAASLFRAHAGGAGQLELELLSTRVHDNAQSGIEVAATDASTVVFTARDSYFERLGSTAVGLAASQSAKVRVLVTGSHIIVPAVVDKPLLTVHGADASAVCVDAFANEIIGGGNPPIRIDGTATAAAPCH
jgi:hypothetical protein